MTQSPLTVTYPLEQVLGQINENLAILTKDVSDIKLAQIKLEAELKGQLQVQSTEIKGLKDDLKALSEDMKIVKGIQQAQVWALIGILGTAVIATVIRFVITAMPNTL